MRTLEWTMIIAQVALGDLDVLGPPPPHLELLYVCPEYLYNGSVPLCLIMLRDIYSRLGMHCTRPRTDSGADHLPPDKPVIACAVASNITVVHTLLYPSRMPCVSRPSNYAT